MVQIICLANSRKLEERCIAGINPQTGRWIRPVSRLYPDDGRVPRHVRLVKGREPALLDLLEIPTEESGPDFGFESENLAIVPGDWQFLKRVYPTDLLQFCDNLPYILHNQNKYVTVQFLQMKTFQERQTLQLAYTAQLSITKTSNNRGGVSWKGSFITPIGQSLTDATITDPVFIERLEHGQEPVNPCLITVSLSLPHRPSEQWDVDPCWKLIAGVIELSNIDLVLVEMRRVQWDVEQGRAYLKQRYGKQSRRDLTQAELAEFLDYLRSL